MTIRVGFYIYSKQPRLLITSLLVVILLGIPIQARCPLDSAQLNLFNDLQTKINNEHFRQADSIVTEYASQRPNAPETYLATAAWMLAQATTTENNTYGQLIRRNIENVLKQTDQYKDSITTDLALLHLLRGHAYSYRSIHKSRFGSRISAIRDGYRAKSEYEKGIKCDSTFYDLYLGLGGFHYWKSAKAGFMRTIGIISNDRQKGIDELLIAKDSSCVSKEPALNALIWIYLNDNKYDTALAICQQMYGMYPDGCMYLWPQAQIYYEMKDYVKSLEIYRLIRKKLVEPGNYYNWIECDFQIVKCLELIENLAEIKTVANHLARYNDYIPQDVRDRQSSKIKYLYKRSQ